MAYNRFLVGIRDQEEDERKKKKKKERENRFLKGIDKREEEVRPTSISYAPIITSPTPTMMTSTPSMTERGTINIIKDILNSDLDDDNKFENIKSIID